jgi:hypothetical protein
MPPSLRRKPKPKPHRPKKTPNSSRVRLLDGLLALTHSINDRLMQTLLPSPESEPQALEYAAAGYRPWGFG